ncbi:MAG: Rieske 2Fe-2S domain-containing protein [Actinomycetota bacterium]
MGPHGLTRRLEGIEGLDSLGEQLAAVAGKALPEGPVKDTLSGTFLGHALHPALTDLPIGNLMSATLLDLVGGERTDEAAQTLIGLGMLASIPTAASGLSDWSDTFGGERRIGLLHAATNVTALLLYGGSLGARRSGRRGLGVALGAVGAGVLAVGGYLGGHLSLGKGIGVDQTAVDHEPTSWTPVVALDDLNDQEPKRVDVGDVPVMLLKRGDEIHALSDRCSHLGGPLHEGKLDEHTVTCPWHQSCFSLADGSVVRGPARAPQPVYETRVEGGKVSIRLRP